MLLTEVKDKLKGTDSFYINYSCDDNYTIAPDGEYFAQQFTSDRDDIDFDKIRSFEDYKKHCKQFYSDSKVIVRGGLVDVRSLIKCTAEILIKTRYWGRFLDAYEFDGQYFNIRVGS